MEVGAYDVKEVLGRGGMGTVHRGVHRALGTTVALKRLTHADPAARALFLQEARLLFGMKHPAFPTVLDLVESHGATWLVMDHVSGPTLTSVVERRHLDPAECRLLVAGMCDALSFLHARGTLHLDVKPDNILLPHGLGAPVLVDLGISARVGQRTQGGFTPGVAPPEQERGLPCTPASDVYQVAATALWCLSGHAPPQGTSRTGDQDLGPGMATVSRLDPGIAAELARALSILPSRRHPGVLDFSRALGDRHTVPPHANATIQPAAFFTRSRLDIRR